MWLPFALLPLLLLVVVVPLTVWILGFRARYHCDRCTPEHFTCCRKEAGKTCPFFE